MLFSGKRQKIVRDPLIEFRAVRSCHKFVQRRWLCAGGWFSNPNIARGARGTCANGLKRVVFSSVTGSSNTGPLCHALARYRGPGSFNSGEGLDFALTVATATIRAPVRRPDEPAPRQCRVGHTNVARARAAQPIPERCHGTAYRRPGALPTSVLN